MAFGFVIAYAYTSEKGTHMPRVTVYVPDDLKALMDEVGEAINWSGIAQQAFQRAILSNNVRRNGSMTNVIDRLRVSKTESENDEHEQALAAGRAWASETASYQELRALVQAAQEATTSGNKIAPVALMLFATEHQPEPTLYDEAEEWLIDQGVIPVFPGRASVTEKQIDGFVQGALNVWEEVSPSL